MKIIKYKYNVFYNIVEFFLEIGRKYLPFIFYKKHILDGKNIYLNKWLTKREHDKIINEADEIYKNIKWE